jgi:hypothetical protein
VRRAPLAGLIAAMAQAGCGTGTPRAVAGSGGEHKPTGDLVIFTENSGNGPTYHVRICDALPRPAQATSGN